MPISVVIEIAKCHTHHNYDNIVSIIYFSYEVLLYPLICTDILIIQSHCKCIPYWMCQTLWYASPC